MKWGRLATTLATLFGLQALRAFFPLLVYVLKDRFGLSSIALGEIALAIFATGFVVPALVRRPGSFRSAAIALLAARAALQLWKGDPAGSLLLAGAAVVAFLAFLAAPGPDRAVGFLVGAALDVSLHALFGTRDLHWGGARADLVAGALVGTAIMAVVLARRETDESRGPAPIGFLAWGPFLLLQLELLGNVARLSARTALPTCASGAIVAAGLAIAAILAPRLARASFARGAALPVLASAFLVPSIFRAEMVGPLAAPLLVLAQVAAALLLIRALEPDADAAPYLAARSAAMGVGAVLLLALLFLHYAGYDLPLPEGRTTGKLVAVAALLVAAAGNRRPSPAGSAPGPRLALVGLALALLPLARGVPARPASAPDAEAAVVVTFNLHAGFDERGGWAFDRMMRELTAVHPDVVALQEVSRGWVINGCADLYELARDQLGLTGTPAPTVTTDWGNAVFVRGPIVRVQTLRLPPPHLLLSRGVVAVERSGKNGGPRRVVATHLHHRAADDAIRDVQAHALASSFSAAPDAVLLADFNAQPTSTCFTILRAAGWVDAAGAPEIARTAPTFPAAAPVRRIDTIFVGDSSRVLSCVVAPAWGSDHRAVIARLRR